MRRMGTTRFEFRVDGRLSDEAMTAFVDMRITEAPADRPQRDVLDESHLHGIVAQFPALDIPSPVGRHR
jgi:hypothetical protein